jgi:hypothetical protein
MLRHRSFALLVPLLALAAVLRTAPVRADCELLYAPPEIRARLLAFHYANEQRRAQERAAHDTPSAPPPAPARQRTRGPQRPDGSPQRLRPSTGTRLSADSSTPSRQRTLIAAIALPSGP